MHWVHALVHARVCRKHVNDQSLGKISYSIAAWPIEGGSATSMKIGYRFVRILMTGKNADGDDELHCAGIELYGELGES